MTRTVFLPYGRRPYPIEVGEDALVCDLPPAPASRPLAEALADALDAPIGSPPLEQLVRAGARALLIVSDASRNDPRRDYIDAVVARLPEGVSVTLAIANGTHAPGRVEQLGLGPWAERFPVINHDARAKKDLVEIGQSSRGTPFCVHRALVDTDVIVATGQIKPHYFAGFGAGVKSIFPGLGEEGAIRRNHELKRKTGARAGVVDGNPCRADLEEILGFLPRCFLLNSIHDAEHECQGAVAGDVGLAFRVGAEQCGPLYRVRCSPRRTVVVSDRLPLTQSLYQASKLAAAGAPWAEENLVIVAECAEGTGPLEVVQEGIFRPGIEPRLRSPAPAIWLVSSLEPDRVARTYCQHAESVTGIPGVALEDALVLPRAGVTIA